MRRLRKLTSQIWSHFGITDRINKFARCNYCNIEISYKSTMANLKAHLQRKHLKYYQKTYGDTDTSRTTEDRVSSIWDHFQDTDNEAKCATCNYCNDALSYETTIDLSEHLKETHLEVYEESGLCDVSSDRESVASGTRAGVRRRSSARSMDSDMSVQSEPENKRSRKVHSTLWAHFDVTDRAAKLATCKYCQNTLSYKTTSANLRCHLKKVHFEEMCAGDDKNVKQEVEVLEHADSYSQRTKVSPLWNHFLDLDPVAKSAQCNYCYNTFSYTTTTGNLKAHLQKKHVEVYLELMVEKMCGTENATSEKTRHSGTTVAPIWSHFEITDTTTKLATCKYCENEFSYKDTLSVLNNHLKEMHLETYQEMCENLIKQQPKALRGAEGNRPRLKVSLLWRHFEKADRVAKLAICLYCNNTLSYKTTTGNLNAHLKHKHTDVYEEYLSSKLEDNSDGESVASAAHSGPRRRMSTWLAESENSPMKSEKTHCYGPVWSHFDISDTTDKLATCKYCEDELSYKDTSILNNHLRETHSETYQEMWEKVIKRRVKILRDAKGNRLRTTLSQIWCHFENSDPVAKLAECLYCNNILSYKSSTGNLNSHIKKQHSDIYECLNEYLSTRPHDDSDGESVASEAHSEPERRMSTWSAESENSASVKSDPFFVAVPHHLRDIMKIGFLGGGRLAYALASGFISAGLAKGDEITASVHPSDLASADAFKSLGATALFENVPVVERSDVVVVSVKPGVVSQVLREVKGSPACKDKLFISVAMGVTIKTIESCLPSHARVVRVMPNTPALVQKGAAVYSLGSRATPEDAQLTQQLMESVGTCEQVPEQSMDAVTALSGSGPAYVYMMIEAMAEGGVRAGLPRDLALRLASQTTLGAAAMVQDGGHPAQLKDNVTSPAGSTAEGTYHLEQKGFRAAIIGAVTAAAERCKVVSAQTK